MTRKKSEFYQIEEMQLIKMCHSTPRFQPYLDRYQKRTTDEKLVIEYNDNHEVRIVSR
jgi:hypothetical protein